MASYLPRKESQLLSFAQNMDSLLKADAAGYGASAEETGALTAATAAFAASYQVAQDPITRSPANIETKNDDKAALIGVIRPLVKRMQGWEGMTNAKRAQLAITIPDDSPTPVPVPSSAPNIDILSVDGWTVTLRLHNGDSTKRAKPAGVKGATIFSYVGDTPPTSVDDWKFEGNVTTTAATVDFPTTLAAGTKVFVTAFWFNTTAESGPAATPVSTQINYGGLSMAA